MSNVRTAEQGLRPETGASVPIALRAEGLAKVVGYYNSVAKTNLPETHERLGAVARSVFAKTFGVAELVESGMAEDVARQMADDFYFGTQYSLDDNGNPYNADKKSFIRDYKGKAKKRNRQDFGALLSEQQLAFQPQQQLPIEEVSIAVQEQQPRRLEIVEDRIILPRYSEVVQAAWYQGISKEDKITLGRLIRLAGEDIESQPDDAEVPGLIPTIKKGLYITLADERYARAQQLIKVGVESGPATKGNFGVVFPADEFHIVARSPRDLARHAQAMTRRANGAIEDRDEVDEKTARSAGHALSGKIAAMSALSGSLEANREFLKKLYKELGSSWSAHYKLKNLERHRVRADEMIHDTAEVASVNLNYDTTAVRALHHKIKKNLYGGNRNHDQIAGTWQAYLTLVGKYIGLRLQKIEVSTQLSAEELQLYQPYLDKQGIAA